MEVQHEALPGGRLRAARQAAAQRVGLAQAILHKPSVLVLDEINPVLDLGLLESVLAQVPDVLAVHGRLAVISFHSLEDRMVKRFIRREYQGEPLPPDLPVAAPAHHPRLKPLGKAIRPGQDELEHNPRARSAVLRLAERLQ